MSDARPMLAVDDLAVEFDTNRGVVNALRGVSFGLDARETLGIVGESGSGKSVTVRAIMRLLPQPPARIVSGRIALDGVDLLTLPRSQMRAHRGGQIAIVYQDAMRALNPTMKVGSQIVEAVRTHGPPGTSRAGARARALELLDAVRIPDAARRFDDYPHQLSGGMRQRVVIAMALAGNPRLLLADEPTTALDVTVQAQILDLLGDLQRDLGMAMILVTHDLGVAAWHTDRIVVMYAGRIVEEGPTSTMTTAMRMPYTRALFDSIPALDKPSDEPLRTVDGRPPDGIEPIVGCAFADRCLYRQERCAHEAPVLTGDTDHRWACWAPLPAHARVEVRA